MPYVAEDHGSLHRRRCTEEFNKRIAIIVKEVNKLAGKQNKKIFY